MSQSLCGYVCGFSLQTAIVKLYKLNDFLLSTEEEGGTLRVCEERI